MVIYIHDKKQTATIAQLSVNNKTKKMKTTSKIGIVTALLVSLAFGSKAQTSGNGNAAASSSGKEWRLSVGPEFGIPTGSYANNYGWLYGGSVQLDIPVLVHGLYVTANAGYDNLIAKKNVANINVQTIPVKAGFKYYVWNDALYVQAQAGVHFLGNKSDLNADKAAAFTYTPSVGYLLKLAPKNYLDLNVRWEETAGFYNGGEGSGGNSYGLVALRVAYSFGL